MNIHLRLLPGCLAAALPLLLLCSCVDKTKKKSDTLPAAAVEAPQQHRTVIEPALLPTRFRQAGYMVREEKDKSGASSLDSLQLKVGANITTNAPIPLREAMKAIVKTKNMSLSWAPDVDQELLVDIDITANDNFYEAIDNILRQLDYFHEMEGSTLVIKYRETKQYQLAMPFIRQYYDSNTGSISGSLKNQLWENKFDQWEIIQKNLDSLIATWSTTVANPEKSEATATADQKEKDQKKAAVKGGEEEAAAPARRVSSTDSTYTIDKPVGLITVNAPKSLQKRVADYLATLEKELYKQIVIEAKIIEVQLSDSSSLGVNWNTLLGNLSVNSTRYSKSGNYSRSSQDDGESKSVVDFSDTTTGSSSAASKVDGTSKETDSSTSRKERLKDNLGTYLTGEGKNITNTTGSVDESINKTSSDSVENTASSSALSSSKLIEDTVSMGATAATFITSASGISEGISTGVTLTGFNFTSFINALQEQGQTSILSNPKISVMNGQPALISVGKNITYIKDVKTTASGESGALSTEVTTAELLSGIGLSLSAVVKKDNEIVMKLVPITSELSGEIQYVTIGNDNRIGLPVVNKREISTTVKIKDGSMLVVGGLISETDAKDGSYLPGAKNSALKYLFGYEEKSKIKRELIILLRPRIIN